MSADDKAAAAWDDYINQQQEEKIEELERELNAANDRIKRLEEVGDAMVSHAKALGMDGTGLVQRWNKAKEAKP